MKNDMITGMRTLFLVLVGCFVLVALPTNAQVGFQTASTISIESSPRFPEPGEAVTLSLNAYALGNQNLTISWYVNGTPQSNFANQRNLSLTAGALGQTTTVRAEIRDGASLLTSSHTITPTQIDIIIEADTTVPAFYQARALPSIGSPVRAVALVDTGKTNGELGYTWSLNNKVIGGGTTRSQNNISFTVPMDPESILGVTVSDSQGRTIASESVIVPNATPEVYFYTDNPLRGLSMSAIGDQYTMLGEEIDVRAEPFYLARNIFTTNPYLQWSIDGQVIDNPNPDPQMITLQNAGGNGSFNIGFSVRNRSQLLQGTDGRFLLRF